MPERNVFLTEYIGVVGNSSDAVWYWGEKGYEVHEKT